MDIDIVLFQPRSNRFDEVAVRYPNGLLSIAALLDKEGYKIKIIDQRLDNKWKHTLMNMASEANISFASTCSTGRQINNVLKAMAIVKETNPNLPIILGGPHATLLPEQTLANEYIDYVVSGEGDITFYELNKTLEKKKDLSKIEGIYYKREGKIKANKPRAFVSNLDTLPRLPYHLIDIKKYSSINFRNKPSADLSTSRGCPFDCGFCYNSAFSRCQWRPYSAKRSVEEIKYMIDTYNIKDFYFVDDNFTTSISRVKDILEQIKKEKLDIRWGTQGVRIDTLSKMDDTTLKLCEETGCCEMSIGVESGSERILKLIDKGINRNDALAVNKIVKNHDFKIKYNFIIGFPTETIEEMKETIKFALLLYEGNKKAWFPFNIYAPYPGSRLYDLAVNEGFKEPKTFEEWAHLEPTGWQDYYGSWFDDKTSEFMRNVNFTSYFAFKSVKQKITNKIARFLFDLYNPIAHYRFKNSMYGLPLERSILKVLEK